MSYIETHSIQHSTILRIYSERDEVKVDPEYQRMGGVWTSEKKALLIDSILNNYDIPKLYFHVFDREEKKKTGFSYAIIDGRQRLEAIWEFIEGKFSLSDDFEYQDEPETRMAGLFYDDISKEYPKIKIKFDSFVLPIIGVHTDDLELIEDMFSRLNEAVPLNAAEKRNAVGGKMVSAIREISDSSFFEEQVAFTNKRYQHREVSARFLLIEESYNRTGKLIDTKKEYLDAMARNYKEGRDQDVLLLKEKVLEVINLLKHVFSQKDPLLRAQGNMVVYYLIGKAAISSGQTEVITRRKLIEFHDLVKQNRIQAEDNYENAMYSLLEYDRLTQQGTNDVSNIKERVGILADYLGLDKSAVQTVLGTGL